MKSRREVRERRANRERSEIMKGRTRVTGESGEMSEERNECRAKRKQSVDMAKGESECSLDIHI